MDGTDVFNLCASGASIISLLLAIGTNKQTNRLNQEADQLRREAKKAKEEAETIKKKMLLRKEKSDTREKLLNFQTESRNIQEVINAVISNQSLSESKINQINQFESKVKEFERILHLEGFSISNLNRHIDYLYENKINDFLTNARRVKVEIDNISQKIGEKITNLNKELEQ